MIARESQLVPLPCFGLEHNSSDSRCQKCKFVASCSLLGESRRGKVRLSRAEFDFTPASLSDFELGENSSLDQLYHLCYQLVYPDAKPDSLYKIKNAGEKLKQATDELGVSSRLYILSCMLALRELSPDSRFYATRLFGPGTQRLVSEYKKLTQSTYGSFDYESLSTMTGGDQLAKFQHSVFNSEVLAGKWILGFKLRNSGDATDLFYRDNELKLNPIWLCLEQSYFEFHDRQKEVNEATRNHRVEVHRVNGWLRKKRTVAAEFFGMRAKLFPKVVETVLDSHGFTSDDFECYPLITDSTKFWSRLALAVQHVRCLEKLEVL